MKYARKLLGLAAVALWTTGVLCTVVAIWVPAVDHLNNLHRTVIGAAVTVTLLWLMKTGSGRADSSIAYRIGYLAGRADEREAHTNARRVRSVRIDDLDVTIVGGGEQPVSDATRQLISDFRRQEARG